MRYYKFITSIRASKKIKKEVLDKIGGWVQGFGVVIDGIVFYVEGKNKSDVRNKTRTIFGKKKMQIFDDIEIRNGKVIINDKTKV